MWRSPQQRQGSAAARLRLAAALWSWLPHLKQSQFLTSTAQVQVAACGRRWGKTEALSVDIATLALDEAMAGRDCRQLVVAPTDDGNIILVIDDISKDIKNYLINMRVQSISKQDVVKLATQLEDIEDRAKVLRIVFEEFRREYSSSVHSRRS